MKALIKKILVIGGLSTLIYLVMSPSIAQADPVCYMVNGSGKVIDLSHLCQSNLRTNTTENQAYFSQKVTENNQSSEPVRTYADIQNYLDQRQNNDTTNNAWADVEYYNRFLEFPSSTAGRTAIRQEVSPRVVRYTDRNYYNIDRPFVVRSTRDLDNMSSQYVLNGAGVLELRYYNTPR